MFALSNAGWAQAPGVALTVSPNPSVFGQTVTLTASITPSSSTGKVTFFDGTSILGESSLSAGQATLATKLLPSGAGSLTAFYSGSTSTAVKQLVKTAPQGGFAPQISYPAGTLVTSVATGDFNGDGKIDVVAAGYQGNNVGVFLGKGDGTFQAVMTYATDLAPYTVAVGDFNGDGKADLVTANSSGGDLSILIGNGDGTFQAAANIPLGSSPRFVAVGDFNGDGIADLATVGLTYSAVTILLGNGDGTFVATAVFAVGANPQSIAITDFNGDGKADLAVANSSVTTPGNGSVSVLLGNGDGTFGSTLNLTADVDPISVAVGDFNGDGKMDLAAANLNSSDVSVFIGKGDGTFHPAVKYATSGNSFVTVGDFNGDGVADLAVTGGGLTILTGTGTGTFLPAVVTTVINGQTCVVADFNGDGRTDVAIADGFEYSVDVALGIPPGTSTTLTSPGNPSIFGQNLILTATVAPAAATGLVTFYDGTAVLGSVKLAAGQATLTVRLSSGTRALRAYYPGDSIYTGSTSATLSERVTAAPSNGFLTEVSYATDLNPTGVAVADFDGDGNSDLVVNNVYGNDVTVFLGKGDGTFRAGVNYSAGLFPTFVAVGDFNGDGKPDVAVSNQSSNQVSVLLGNGDGTFQNALNYAVGVDPEYIAVGDFNADGKADLVTANGSGGSVSVLLGNGDGTFCAATTLTVGGTPTAVAVGDLNGDGKADLFVTDFSAGGDVDVLLGHGDGTFGSALNYPAGSGPHSLALADFNGDGYLDIAVADYETGTSAAILYGTATGVPGAPVSYPAGGSAPAFVIAEDFNGDGKPDLAVANYAADTVNVLLNNGDKTFQAPVAFGTGMHPYRLASGDFNGDGRVDIAVINIASQTVSILLGKAPPATATLLSSSPTTAPYGRQVALTATVSPSSATGNVTFYDGVTVLGSVAIAGGQAVLNTSLLASGTRTLHALYSGNSTGAASVSNTITQIVNPVVTTGFSQPVEYSAGYMPAALAVGDFNGDGRPDLLVGNSSANNLTILLNGGKGVFQVPVTYKPGATSVAVGDFNGDGKTDLAVANSASAVSILLGNGDGTFQTAVSFATGGSPQCLAVGDFNGDGYADLAVATIGAGVSVLLGKGDGTFQAAQNFVTGVAPYFVAVGDFNGDGKADLAVANHGVVNSLAVGWVAILTGNGNGSFQPAVSYPLDGFPSSLTVGDFNGDGVPDIATANESANTISVLINNGDGTFGIAKDYPGGQNPISIVSGDFNGDGHVDLAVADYNQFNTANDSVVSVFYGVGDGTFPSAASYFVNTAGSGNPTALAAADFNGDGRSDLAVANAYDVVVLEGRAPVGTTSSAITVTSSQNPSVYGQSATFTATVTPAGATGTVTFYDGVELLSTEAVANGKAALSTVLLDSGVHTIKATYSGDATYEPMTSSSLTQTVNAKSTAGFVSAPTLATASTGGPDSIVRGDFNGDGKVDLAVAEAGGTVGVFLGNGDGTFQAPVNYAVGTSPKSIASADFNGDGYADLVIANFSDETVSILLGNGDGTFRTGPTFFAGGSADTVVVADFNGDGNADLALDGGVDGGGLNVLLGNGDGTFAAPTPVTTVGSVSLGLAAGDFNGDGKPDLVASLSATGTLTVLLGNGDGTFRTPLNINVGGQPEAIAIGDFNGDGKTDIAVNTYSGYPAITGSVVLLLGNGNGTFQTQGTYVLSGVPQSLIAVDFNGDGRTDFAAGTNVIQGNAAYSVNVFLIGANGAPGTPAIYATGNSPVALAAGDFNGDSRADLASANYSDKTLTILLGASPTAGAAAVSLVASPSPAVYGQNVTLTATVTPSTATGTVTFTNFSQSLGTATLSGGVATLTLTSASYLITGVNSFVAAYSGDANNQPGTSGKVTETVTVAPTTTFLTSSANPAAYAQSDILLTATVTPASVAGSVAFYQGTTLLASVTPTNGVATYDPGILPAGAYSLKAVYGGDANHGSSTSSVLTETVSQARAGVTLDSSANPSITGGSVTLRATVSPSGATGNVVFQDASTVLGTVALSGGAATYKTAGLSLGSHALTAAYAGDANVSAGVSPTLTQVVNAARTGTSQITMTSSANPANYGAKVTLQGTVSPSAATGNVTFYDGVTVLGTATLSSGVATVAVLLPSSGARTLKAFYGGDATYAGSSTTLAQTVIAQPGVGFGTVANYAAGAGALVQVVADFNGDGNADLAVANTTGNTVSVLRGNGDGTFQAAVTSTVAGPPGSMAGGDFNGDGIGDLAVTIPSGDSVIPGTLSVLIGKGDGTFTVAGSYPSLDPGTASSVALMADFDGDGKADLAVANAVTGDVSVFLGNGDGSFRAAIRYPALASATGALVGDFNGDGKPDIVVVRPYTEPGLAVLIGNGDGTFQSPLTSNVNLFNGSLAAGDFDGDGKTDLVVGVVQAQTDLLFLAGNGDGTFHIPVLAVSVAGNPGPEGMTVGDFNGDGKLDIATVGCPCFAAGDSAAYVVLGNGDGTFQNAARYVVGQTASPIVAASIVAGDFNGDGVADLALGNPASANINVFTATPAPRTPQTITFGPLSSVTYGVMPFGLTATASSGLTVSFAFTTPAVCGPGVQILSAGTCSITATQLGNATYQPAPPVVQTFTVNPAAQTITFPFIPDVSAGSSSFAINPTTSSGLPVTVTPSDATVCNAFYSGGSFGVTAYRPGTCTLSANQAGNANYLAAPTVTRSFGITGTAQTITFPTIPNTPLSSGQIALTASSTSMLPIAFSVLTSSPVTCFLSGNSLVLSGAGTCTVTASQPGNSVFLAAPPITRNFTVVGAAQTITFGALPNVPVTTAPFALGALASSTLAVSYVSNTLSVCTVSGSEVTILAGGGCSITASQAGNSTYAAAAPVTQSFTVFFGDVAPTDYYYAAINAMAQLGITAGCGNNNYCPLLLVTRDQMAIFIVRAILGSDNFTYTTTPYFTDVTPTTFGFKWIQKLKDLGITSGCTTTTYCPTAVVARDQMAVFIERARLGVSIAGPTPTFTYPSTPLFTDVSATNDFAYAWIQRLKQDNITSGCTTTTYCPVLLVSRGDMALFIMRGAFNQFLPAGTPLLAGISPSILPVGTTGTFTITGTSTNFVQGVTTISPIPGVTIGAVTVTGPTSFTVQLTAAANAVAQPYSILAITGTEQDVLPNGLVIQ